MAELLGFCASFEHPRGEMSPETVAQWNPSRNRQTTLLRGITARGESLAVPVLGKSHPADATLASGR